MFQSKALAIGLLAGLANAGGQGGWLPRPHHSGGPVCTVRALGNQQNDVPNILSAFRKCGQSGTVVFPEGENYWIAERLNPVVRDVKIDWRGQWTLSPDLDYWRNNSYPIAFQNHHAGFILTGDGIEIDGHNTGGIFGNGETWYDAEAGNTQPGRPMPFVFWNVSEVKVSNFYVKQPPLWSINIMNGTNMYFDNIYVNATAANAPAGKNWVQNTDGFDTMDARNIHLTNFVYQGGDDCLAIKPRSYYIYTKNVTCHGGNGVAIGSLGQYLEDSSVENVFMEDLKLPGTVDGVYIKTWVGYLVPQSSYESAGLPRGGGWGNVSNLVFQNVNLTGSKSPLNINQDSGNNGSYSGTSKMLVSDVYFKNFYGTVASTSDVAKISCSTAHPCFGIYFEDMEVKSSNGSSLTGSCKYTAAGGIHGLPGC